MRTRKSKSVDFTALWDAAACGARAARWRQERLERWGRSALTREEIAEATRELSWRHPEARGGRR